MNEKKQSLLGSGEEVRAVCTPDSGAAGVNVTITAAPASEPPGFRNLTILGGIVTSLETGIAERLENVEAVEDGKIYTATIPNDLDGGHYDIIIDLISHVPGAEESRFTIKASYEVEGHEQGGDPEVTRITPSTVSRAEFNTKMFTARGRNFDEIYHERGAQIFTETGLTRLTLTPQSNTSFLMRATNPANTPPSVGIWVVQMYTRDGMRISSASKLQVTEE